jgi:hypothetical protein
MRRRPPPRTLTAEVPPSRLTTASRILPPAMVTWRRSVKRRIWRQRCRWGGRGAPPCGQCCHQDQGYVVVPTEGEGRDPDGAFFVAGRQACAQTAAAAWRFVGGNIHIRTQGGREVREGAVFVAAVGMQNRGRSSRARQERRGGGGPCAGGRVGIQARSGAGDNDLGKRTTGSRSSGGGTTEELGLMEWRWKWPRARLGPWGRMDMRRCRRWGFVDVFGALVLLHACSFRTCRLDIVSDRNST